MTAGDLDADGFAEVIAGSGPGGGPRVVAFSGSSLIQGSREERANFFAGDSSARSGVRLAAKDLDGDSRADLVTSAGARVVTYLGRAVRSSGPPPESDAFDGLDAAAGLYVG